MIDEARVPVELVRSCALGDRTPITHGQGWQNDSVSPKRPPWGRHISGLLKGIRDPVTLLSGGDLNQDRKVVMSGCFWT